MCLLHIRRHYFNRERFIMQNAVLTMQIEIVYCITKILSLSCVTGASNWYWVDIGFKKYSWARPAILATGKGEGGIFLFILFPIFHSFSSFSHARGAGGGGGAVNLGVIVVRVFEPIFRNPPHSYTWPLKKRTHSYTKSSEMLTHSYTALWFLYPFIAGS